MFFKVNCLIFSRFIMNGVYFCTFVCFSVEFEQDVKSETSTFSCNLFMFIRFINVCFHS